MCHPQNEPAISLAKSDGFEVFVNRTSGYGNAVRSAIQIASAKGKDLVLADSDGYHPAREIVRLARFDLGPDVALVKPYREGIGFQSKCYSFLYSIVKIYQISDATGGLYRLSHNFMESLPLLKAKDMTINVEILNHVLKSRGKMLQYGYVPGENDLVNSKRTKGYQLKLLKAML
jgi:hypothetical protein